MEFFVMTKFYLATVAAVVVSTSLASNILVVGTRGSARPEQPKRTRSSARRWMRRFRHLVDAWVAAMIESRERQTAIYALNRLSDRDLRDIGLDRGSIRHMVHCPEQYAQLRNLETPL
jgi:uncharacterized protein YjiS (DUF1127 family)